MRRSSNLWRRRLPLVAGALVAIIAAMTIGRSHGPPIGVATTNVLIDTPQSEVAAAAPHGSDTLWWRATLLGMLLGTNSERQQIARAIGAPAGDIGVSNVELNTPIVPAALPVAAIQAASMNAQYVVTVQTNDVLPMVSLAATAPDRTRAVRLAQAAADALQRAAPGATTLHVQGLRIRRVGAITSWTAAVSAGHTKMIAIALVVFLVWWLCLAIGRRLRAHRAQMRRPHLA